TRASLSAGREVATEGRDDAGRVLSPLAQRAELGGGGDAVDPGDEALEVAQRLALAADGQQGAGEAVVGLERVGREAQQLAIAGDRRLRVACAQGQRREVGLGLGLARVAAQR